MKLKFLMLALSLNCLTMATDSEKSEYPLLGLELQPLNHLILQSWIDWNPVDIGWSPDKVVHPNLITFLKQEGKREPLHERVRIINNLIHFLNHTDKGMLMSEYINKNPELRVHWKNMQFAN